MIYKVNDVTLRPLLLSDKEFIDIEKKNKNTISSYNKYILHFTRISEYKLLITDLVNITRSMNIM